MKTTRGEPRKVERAAFFPVGHEMLLGYQADNGEAVVTAIIGPGPNARHRRNRFTPNSDYQQAQLEAHFWKTPT